jgi:hypothetical protein
VETAKRRRERERDRERERKRDEERYEDIFMVVSKRDRDRGMPIEHGRTIWFEQKL